MVTLKAFALLQKCPQWHFNVLKVKSDREIHLRHNVGSSNPYEYPHQHHRQSSSQQQLPGLGLEREQLEPQFLIKGQKITAKLGDTVVLPCKVANLGESVDSTVETLYKVLY